MRFCYKIAFRAYYYYICLLPTIVVPYYVRYAIACTKVYYVVFLLSRRVFLYTFNNDVCIFFFTYYVDVLYSRAKNDRIAGVPLNYWHISTTI